MTEFYERYTIHQMLIQPIKLFGHPKIKDKIDALSILKPNAELNDIEYIYPLVFEKNIELASTAAQIVADIMRKVQGSHWNSVYDKVKYTKVDIVCLNNLLVFTPEISSHLLGVASLNYNGYIREKSLSLISGVKSQSSIPYILLRLNDWVIPVRGLAERILENILTNENVEAFINNAYLINKLQNVLRVDLKITREKIINYLKHGSYKDKIKTHLKHPHIKTRLFCYMLLSDRLSYEDDVISSALKDKSLEVRIWLVENIKTLEEHRKVTIIEKLLKDKSGKVKTSILRNYEDIVCMKFREKLEELIYDEYASVRDEARFVNKKHGFIKDFSEFYRKKILDCPVSGALIGLGETGNKNDFVLVRSFYDNKDPKIRLAAMTAMWYLSKDDAARDVLDSLDSDYSNIRKTARRFVKNSKMPIVVLEMKEKLKSVNPDTQLFALDTICCYGGWHALEGVLYSIVNWNGQCLEKAKDMLNYWLIRSSNLYSRPDSITQNKITNFIEIACNQKLISDNKIKEIQFILQTRR